MAIEARAACAEAVGLLPTSYPREDRDMMRLGRRTITGLHELLQEQAQKSYLYREIL